MNFRRSSTWVTQAYCDVEVRLYLEPVELLGLPEVLLGLHVLPGLTGQDALADRLVVHIAFTDEPLGLQPVVELQCGADLAQVEVSEGPEGECEPADVGVADLGLVEGAEGVEPWFILLLYHVHCAVQEDLQLVQVLDLRRDRLDAVQCVVGQVEVTLGHSYERHVVDALYRRSLRLAQAYHVLI